MSIGQRFRAFLKTNLISYRDVEVITGVSKSEAARIGADQCGPTVEVHIRKMVPRFQAAGYSVTVEQLLEGLDPKGDLEGIIRNSAPEKRLDYIGMTVQERVRLTLDFLREHYPAKCPADLLAAIGQLQVNTVERLISQWDDHVPDSETATRLGTAIHRLTGISLEWFRTGWLSDENPFEFMIELIRDACGSALTTSRVMKQVVDLIQNHHAA